MKHNIISCLIILSSYISTAQPGVDVTEVSEFMPYQIMSFLTTTLGEPDDDIQKKTTTTITKTPTLIPYRNGSVWGYCDANKELKIPLQYEYASRFYNNIAYVKKGDDYFFIDTKGEKLSNINWVSTGQNTAFQTNTKDSESYSFKHTSSNQYRNSLFDGSRLSDQGLLKVYSKQGRAGVINVYGKTIVPTRYDDISFVNEGMIITKLDNALGVYTKEGKEVIPPRYDIIYDFNQGLARVKKSGYEGMVSATGEEIISFRAKYRQVVKNENYITVIDDSDYRGLYDLKGKLILPVSYLRISSVKDHFFITKKEGEEYTLVNASTLTPYSESYFNIKHYNDDILIAETKERKKILLNLRTGKHLHKGSYDRCRWNSSTKTITVYRSGKQGIIDSEGKEVIPMGVYDDIDQLEKGYFKVRKEESWLTTGLANTEGKLIIPTKYGDFRVYGEVGLIAVFNEDRKWGLFDMKGNQLSDFIYDKVSSYDTLNYLIVKQDKGYGMVNTTGTLVLPCKYEKISARKEYLIVQNTEGKYGTVNTEGKPLIPCLYDRSYGRIGYDIIINEFQEQILITSEGNLATSAFHDRVEKITIVEGRKNVKASQPLFFTITKDGLKGVISHEGKVIIPPKYYKIYYQVGSLFLVDYTGEGKVYGYVDTKGQEYFKN